MITFNLGTLVYRFDVIKNEDESIKLNTGTDNEIEVKNFYNAHLNIKDMLAQIPFQNIINRLEPGSYELSIDLSSENFKRIETVDGIIEDNKNDQS